MPPLRTPPRPGVLLLAAGVSFALGVVPACGSSTVRPKAMLSGSTDAEVGFRSLVKEWIGADSAGRVRMAPRLVAFRVRFREDPLERAADALLAWVELERGQPEVARRHAVLVESGGPGVVSDIATTVEGASLRRSGRPDAALAVLGPLVSKIIDPYVRTLFNEEATLSAVAALRWPRALDLLRVWLREADPEDRERVHAQVEALLHVVPPDDLARELDKVPAGEGGDDAFRKLVAGELAAVAQRTKDAALAERLVRTSGTLLGDQADSVALLASGTNKARVEPRTVGLVISLRNEVSRRRGIQVAAGLAHGLGLPGSEAHLVSRDDGGDLARMDQAIASLASEGASVVVGGMDELESEAIARYAVENRVPVVVLRAPKGGLPQSPFVFTLGEDPAAAARALVTGLLARGKGPIGVVLDPTTELAPTADVTLRRCGDTGAPWKGYEAVVLAGSEPCSREVFPAVSTLKVRLAGGFDALGVPLPNGSLIASAGVFPVDPAAAPLTVRRWVDLQRAVPTWWNALGRDAGVLAWAAVQALPAQGTEDPKEIALRRTKAAEALSAATAELWTSRQQGFSGTRTVGRDVSVREVSTPTTRSK